MCVIFTYCESWFSPQPSTVRFGCSHSLTCSRSKAKLIRSRDNIHNIKFSRGDSLFLSVEMSGLLRELELTYHPTKQTNTIFPILSTSFQPMLLSIFLSPERNS